jgi:TP901 family phage tail tape measure protein
MTGLVLPTYFKAIDQFSGPVVAMQQQMGLLGNTAEATSLRSQRAFGNLGKAFDGSLQKLAKPALEFATAAALTGLFVGAIYKGVDAIEKYDKALYSLQVVTGTNGAAFEKYKEQIRATAEATKKNVIDTAGIFEIFAKSNPALKDNADALGQVTKASIILSKVSGSDLAPTAEVLATVYDKYQISADKAMSVTDAFAVSQQYSRYGVLGNAEAVAKFADTAKAYGISLQQSIALTAIASQSGEDAASAGSKLQKILANLAAADTFSPKTQLALAKYGISLQSLKDPAIDIGTKLHALTRIQGDASAMTEVFGKRNVEFGRVLLQNAGTYDLITSKSGAQGAALDILKNKPLTLSIALNKLSDAWINIVTSSETAGGGLQAISKILVFVANNLNYVVDAIALVAGAYLAVKTWTFLTYAWAAAVTAYNAVVLGAEIATDLWAAAQVVLNAALVANPIGLIVTGIALLIGYVYEVTKHWNEWGAAANAVFGLMFGRLAVLISVFATIYNHWSQITKAFETNGIVGGLKAIGAALLDVVLAPLEQIFKLWSNLPSWLGGGLAGSAANGIDQLRQQLATAGTTPEDGSAGIQTINPAREQAEINNSYSRTNTTNHTLDVNVHAPAGSTVSNSRGIAPTLTDTLVFG